MKDRNVEFPHRFRLTPVEGTDNIVDITPVPGDVIEEGSLWSKANVLPDYIPNLLGLKMADPQVKDALDVLANVGNIHVWKRDTTATGVTDYPTSTDPDAYTEGTTGDETYTYLGALGDKTRIEVGSYVGTGTYGADNPNTLTFEFEPKIVMVNNNGQYGVIAIRDSGGALCAANIVQQTVSWSEKTVSWYCSGTQTNANNQMNQSNGIYKYVAIG